MNQAHDQAQPAAVPPAPSGLHRPPSAEHPPDVPSGAVEEARFARSVLEAEAAAIERIQITDAFHQAVQLILDIAHGPGGGGHGQAEGGSVVVSGLGKSGLVGQKISATLASTGTPSHFLHPAEAMHGDLGRVRRGDVVLMLSFGGSTDEVVSLAAVLRQDQVPVISVVGKPTCDLARLSTVALSVGDVAEACPLNLAPTASTTAMLALGDALALAVSRRRRFGVDDFRRFHPGGVLGRKLMPVVEAMRFRVNQGLPLVDQEVIVAKAIRTDAPLPGARRAGAVLVVDREGQLAGIFTDGDLRRLLIQLGPRALDQPIKDVMTANPRRLTQFSLVRDAVQMVREFRIDEVPVVDSKGQPLGMIDVQDLVALKVIEGSIP